MADYHKAYVQIIWTIVLQDYARLLHRRAVAYLNVDMSVDGK